MTSIEQSAANRARAREHVRAINARTVCAHCGAQPIEWHNPEHINLNRQIYRIGKMVSRGSRVELIEAEMARCTPLCRRCHMAEDGRLRSFIESGGGRLQKGTSLPPKLCVECGKPSKPLSFDRCMRCYGREQRRQWAAKHAGLKRLVKVRSTGTCVAVYDCEAQGFDTDGGRWSMVCETHGCVIAVPKLWDALHMASHPEDWCDVPGGCTGEPQETYWIQADHE